MLGVFGKMAKILFLIKNKLILKRVVILFSHLTKLKLSMLKSKKIVNKIKFKIA